MLIVFASHTEVFLPLPTLLVVPGGTVSLDMFFVLSGFLITALLLREQQRRGLIDRVAFYRRRVMRLLPALGLVVVVTAVFLAATHHWDYRTWPSIFSVSFYYSNYYVANSPNAFCANLAPGFQAMWSLSFEEQFYLLWPFITIGLLTVRMKLRTVVIILLTLITIVAVHRALYYQGIVSWCADFHRTDTRADSILWGALAAHLWVRGKEPVRFLKVGAWIAAGILLICLPTANLTGPFLYRGGLVLIDISCAVIVLAVLDRRWGGRWLFERRAFIGLGVVSYGFYLWHMPVFWAIRYYDNGWPYAVRVLAAFAITLGLTLASWYGMERPIMRWKDRIEAQKRDASPAPQGS